MDKFTRELSRELTKRLPQNIEYGWSHRIEGYLERSESTAPHDNVAIIVDSEISSEELNILGEKLYAFIKSDKYFRRSYYRVLLWKQNELSLVSPKRVSNIGHLKKYFEKIEAGSSDRSDWDSFWQLYKPHKRAGQVILITTGDKGAIMGDSKAIGIKNLLVIYQGTAETKVKEMIKNIPCIANLPETKMGKIENE